MCSQASGPKDHGSFGPPVCSRPNGISGSRFPCSRNSGQNAPYWNHRTIGQRRLLPGAAGYPRCPGQTAYFLFVLTVLRLEHGRLTDIAAFEQPSMFTAFGLPASV